MEVMMIPSHEAQIRDWPEALETLLSSYVWYGGSIG